MSWSIGFDDSWNRDIGYGVPAWCDHPKCAAEIDRGLSYVCCGDEPYGGEHGCGLYFCATHRGYYGQCARCRNRKPAYTPKPDHPRWIRHKLDDQSWAEWRASEPDQVEVLRVSLSEARD